LKRVIWTGESPSGLEVRTTKDELTSRHVLSLLRETNLKIKQALPQTISLVSPTAVSSIKGHILSESPNASVHTYTGSLHLSSSLSTSSSPLPLGPDQMLLRGAQLRNTGWVYGVVVVGGKETKLMRNAT
jgi:phospholipid-transporting ATPase